MEHLAHNKQVGVFLGLINEFETFFNRLNKRREQLEELKDELLIYGDKGFMSEIKEAEREIIEGKGIRLKSNKEMDEWFDNL